jgi:imidazolonepropionase-like amidohydrolase
MRCPSPAPALLLCALAAAGAPQIVQAAAAAPAAAPTRLEPIVLPPPATPGPAQQPYIKRPAGHLALTHLNVLDGRGGPALPDRTVLLEGGKIAAILAPGAAIPLGTEIIDLSGHTALPGLVGMHDHLFYIARPNFDAAGQSEPPLVVPEMPFTAPRLYLANGVTTIRTTGSVEPTTDLNLKHQIDTGVLPGPHTDVTGPYLEGPDSYFIQMPQLKSAQDAREVVNFWADRGVTSFKAYMNITRPLLKAAIEAAHARGLKVTGHLCAVTYREAAALGIDNLEHGFYVNTEHDVGKRPDTCSDSDGEDTLYAMDPAGAEARSLIADLVAHHVAITSTLPVFEQTVPGRAPLWPRALAVLTPSARQAYFYARTLTSGRSPESALRRKTSFEHDLALERAFVAAGGLLIAGPDPTGNGGTIPGFADLREVELLVEAGFTPPEAVRIATYNGAHYLGLEHRIGSLAAGLDADLLIVKGDPAKQISDIENVEWVFKDGVGYDPRALLESVRGRYGEY